MGTSWTVAWHDDVLRVFARRTSRDGIVGAIIGMLFCAAMLALLFWTMAKKPIPQQQATTIVIGFSLAAFIGLLRILVGTLGGNIRESRRPDVLRYDRATGWITLPRSDRSIRFDDAIRLELVRFWAGRNHRYRLDHLVLCSRGADGEILYDLVTASPGRVRRAGEELATELPLPLVKIRLREVVVGGGDRATGSVV
jgi:hypothetical protein